MAERRPKLLFEAIAAIEAAVTFVGSANQAQYDANLLLRSGVERQLEILGEACVRLAKEDDTLLTQLPACRLAIGMRNRIIHGYDAVDDETVYRTVLDDLPALRDELAAYLELVVKRQAGQ